MTTPTNQKPNPALQALKATRCNDGQAAKAIAWLLERMPRCKQWLAGLPDNDKAALEKGWRVQLQRLHIDDVREAVRQLRDGEVDLPANYEFDRLGYYIRQTALRISEGRVAAEETARRRLEATDLPPMDRSRFGTAKRVAMDAGLAKEYGIITPQRNADIMASVHLFMDHKIDEVVGLSADEQIELDTTKRRMQRR